MVKMIRIVLGTATAIVGRKVTRNWNQAWMMNSRHSNGYLVVALATSTHIWKKPPTAFSGPCMRARIRPPTPVAAVIATPTGRDHVCHRATTDRAARTLLAPTCCL